MKSIASEMIIDMKAVPRSGRSIVENDVKLMEIIESDHHESTILIADELNISQKNSLEQFESLLNHKKNKPFLKQMGTDDEKWITYSKIKRKQSWSKGQALSQTVYRPSIRSITSNSPTAKPLILTCTVSDWIV